MARSFQITLGSPAPYAISVQQSDDGATGWAETDNVLVSALTDLGAGVYRLDAANALTTKYVRLVPEDSGSPALTGTPNRIYAPQTATSGTWTVSVDMVTLGMVAKSGRPFSVKPLAKYIKLSGNLAAGSETVKTGDGAWADGYAELTVPADAGKVMLAFLPEDETEISVTVDTTGRSTTVVDFKDLLS